MAVVADSFFPMREAVKRVLPAPVLDALRQRHKVTRVASIARCVTDPVRFAANEVLLRDGKPRRWRLRNGGEEVLLRSGGRDHEILEEIFLTEIYRPPTEAWVRLAERRPLRVLDLGANIGLFGVDVLRRFPGASIVAIEPDPSNLRLLRAAASGSGLGDRWRIHPVAAGVSAGHLRFVAGRQSDSFIAGPAEDGMPTIDVEVIDVFPHLRACDYLKMDIEGGEWPVLLDARFADLELPVIALEYHARHSPITDYRAAAEGRLTEVGYTLSHVLHFPELGYGQLWAWR